MTQLSDLFDMQLFREMQDAGFIKVQRHPEFPDDLAIVNYTAKAQQNYHWNSVTEQCRGLIYNPVTLQVLQRPFSKFYNYDEKQAPFIPDDTIVTAYDKLDGSLGIPYATPDGEVAIATRGSFTSDQALWATARIRSEEGVYKRFKSNVVGYQGRLTDLFEIIYHDNRIVVNYHDEGVRYLLTRDVIDGKLIYVSESWEPYTLSAPELYHGTFKGLWDLEERHNAEGYVVHAGQRMVKVKYEEYVRLHRIVTRLSERAIWEMMGGPNPDKIDDLVSRIPEEHGRWARDVAHKLMEAYIVVGCYLVELQMQLEPIKGKDIRETRKLKALHIKDESPVVKSCIFALLDGKTYDQILWNALRPKGDDVDN